MAAAVTMPERFYDETLQMIEEQRPRTIREVFDDTMKGIPDEGATIGDVTKGGGRKSSDVLILLSAIAAGIILQVPVLPSFFAIPVIYLGVTQVMGIKNLWLFGARKINIDGKAVKEGLEYAQWEMENAEEAVSKVSEKFAGKAKKLPSMPEIPGSRELHGRLQGMLTVALGLMVMSPIPGTHTLPALGLIMLSTGRLANNRALTAAAVGYSTLIGLPVPAYATYKSYGSIMNFFKNPIENMSNIGLDEVAIGAIGIGAAYGAYRYLKHRWGKFQEYKNPDAQPAPA